MSTAEWIFLSLAIVAAVSLVVSVWGLHDDIVDIAITRKAHSRLLQVALLRIGRDIAACVGELVLLALSIGVLIHADRTFLGWVLVLGLFDYPVLMLIVSTYDRILRWRRGKQNG